MRSRLPEAYFDTVFKIPGPPDQIPPSFVIITAYNPMDDVCPPEDNREADQTLKSLLEAEHLNPFRATGVAPDLSHSEPGWAFETDLPKALEIARRFRQRALWWVEDNELYLVDCRNPIPIPVGQFSDRILNG